MAGRSDSGDGLLLSRVHDAFRIARDSCVVKHIGFLDEHGAALCASALKGQNEVDVRFFGGHEDAERTVLGLFPKGEEIRWPIAALTLLTRQEASLSHRDYLGSMLALGIARESVGDLLCEPGRCVAFLMPSVVPVIRDELTRIGREGVRIAEGYRSLCPRRIPFARSPRRWPLCDWTAWSPPFARPPGDRRRNGSGWALCPATAVPATRPARRSARATRSPSEEKENL